MTNRNKETCKTMKTIIKDNKKRIKGESNPVFIKTLKKEISRAKKIMKKEKC